MICIFYALCTTHYLGRFGGGSDFFAGMRCKEGATMPPDGGCQIVAMTSVDIMLYGVIHGA